MSADKQAEVPDYAWARGYADNVVTISVISAYEITSGEHNLCRCYLSLLAERERLREALEGMLDALAMGPLDLAARYGPDAHPDEAIVDAAHKARAALQPKD